MKFWDYEEKINNMQIILHNIVYLGNILEVFIALEVCNNIKIHSWL